MIAEDMCYKSGCFISPAMFCEFMLLVYQGLTDFYRSHDIDAIYVDLDGDVMDMISLLIEGDVNGLHPFVDKKEIAKERAAIDAELNRSARPIYSFGGFIPFVDHTIPPQMSWDDFRSYRNQLEAIWLK